MRKLIAICCVTAVLLSNIAVANITITPNSGANYTYQRWDFDTTETITSNPPMPYLVTIGPETDQNPYGDLLASITAYGTTSSKGGWYNTGVGPAYDVMHAGPYKMLIVGLTIPNVENKDMRKIVQLEFAYTDDPMIVPSITAPQGAVLDSTVSGIDQYGWREMTYTWSIYPQPASETINLVFVAGATGVDLNYLEVATVCVPEPATIGLLGLGALSLLRKRRA